MKLLTQGQLAAVLRWFDERCSNTGVEEAIKTLQIDHSLDCLITAECREHGFAGYEDAVKQLVEDGKNVSQ